MLKIAQPGVIAGMNFRGEKNKKKKQQKKKRKIETARIELTFIADLQCD
jgi:hypothetical protein